MCISIRRLANLLLGASLCAVLLVSSAAAQEPATPVARPEDVASIDAIIGAVYDVISGPAGEARDWERFRSLFATGARLIPTRIAEDGSASARALTPDEYIEMAGSYLEQNGFFESEIGRVTEEFGHIAHVFSAYDSKHTLEDAEPFQRGINSMQLLNDGGRWWLVSIYWEAERPDNPIPERYLGVSGSIPSSRFLHHEAARH